MPQPPSPTFPSEQALRRASRPWWWLLFAPSFYLPIQVTFGLLSLVLVPADVATIVGAENKARYLGVTVTIMMVIQNCQPIFGSISDKTRSRFGRRRPYVILGQVLSVAALVVMRNATTFWPYCLGYQLYQVGNCTIFATLCAIQPALKESQRGMYGGYISLCQALGFLGAAVLGYANGNGVVTHDQTYAILFVLQLVLLLVGIASFSESPGFWLPELDAPSAEEERLRREAQAATAAVGVWGQLSAVALDIIAPFRRPVFRWLFIYYIMYGVSFQITNTYTQYYLADVIGPDFSLQLPGGKRLSVVDNAESAISFMNIMCAPPIPLQPSA